jgi:hypothetical protein
MNGECSSCGEPRPAYQSSCLSRRPSHRCSGVYLLISAGYFFWSGHGKVVPISTPRPPCFSCQRAWIGGESEVFRVPDATRKAEFKQTHGGTTEFSRVRFSLVDAFTSPGRRQHLLQRILLQFPDPLLKPSLSKQSKDFFREICGTRG